MGEASGLNERVNYSEFQVFLVPIKTSFSRKGHVGSSINKFEICFKTTIPADYPWHFQRKRR